MAYVKAKRKKRKKEKASDYISNKAFTKKMQEWKIAYEHYKVKCEAEQKSPKDFKIPNHLAEDFYKIARHLSNNKRFKNYKFKDDMIQDAMLHCCKYAFNFKKDSNNAFAYFSQICWNAFVQRIKKEYRTSDIKKIMKDEYKNSLICSPECKMNKTNLSKIKNF